MKIKYKEMLMVGLFTALMGQVNFYPFGTDFRITIGVVAFTFLMLYFHTIPIIASSIVTGIFVLAFRVGIDFFANSMAMDAAVYKHLPGMMYYIAYGIIIEGARFRKLFEKPIYFMLALTMADILSNIFELFIRNQLNHNSFDAIFSTIMLAAVIRSCLVLALFWVIKYYSLFVTKEEHQRRYKELLVLTSKLKSEIYFLKKSMQDIENAMVKSYKIYNTIKESNPMSMEEVEKITADCLNLSIDIHEIKKDYNRIVISMEKLLPTGDNHKTMRISDIFETIGEIFNRYIEVIDKDIILSFEYKENFRVSEYFIIMSILNNMIQNSIEACFSSDSFVKVRCFIHESMLVFAVRDNGKGIGKKERELIFEPGYTTKFNPETGHVSTGLGLTHIRILLEHLEGSININEDCEDTTEFVIEIPMNRIVSEVEDND
ncbi:MAG: ATP-binding protein [Clostridiaceae bacterium]|nr:ATP-binding protein [Clostridiaceae bacterium]